MGNHNSNLNPQKQSYYSVEYLNGEFSLDTFDALMNPHLNSNIERTLIDSTRPTQPHRNNSTTSETTNTTATSSDSNEPSRGRRAAHQHEEDENDYAQDEREIDDESYENNLTYSSTSSSGVEGRNDHLRPQLSSSSAVLLTKGSKSCHRSSSKRLSTNEQDYYQSGENLAHEPLVNQNPLGLVRSGVVLVQRSKSYVRPENKVLPIEFPQRPLRQTNLLKTEGAKRTWRAVNPSRSHSALAPSTLLLKGSRTDFATAKQQSTLVYRGGHIKPSLIKSLVSSQHGSAGPTKSTLDHDATSNDELTDLEESQQRVCDFKPTGSAWTISNLVPPGSSSASSSSSVDNLKNVRNEINNYREKYSRSMGNIANDGWHCDESFLGEDKSEVTNASSVRIIRDRMEADRFNVDMGKFSGAAKAAAAPNHQSPIKKSKSIAAAASASAWSLANKLRPSIISKPTKEASGAGEKEENLKILKKLKSKSFLSQIRSYKQNLGAVGTNNGAIGHYQSRILANSRFSKKRTSLKRSAAAKLESRCREASASSTKTHHPTSTVTTDIKIISRFPINSKAYRHYIAGNGNKCDKLTNSIEIKNVLRQEMSPAVASTISFLGGNERGIDVNEEDEPGAAATTSTCEEFEPTYDSIDDYQNSTGRSKATPSPVKDEQKKSTSSSTGSSSSEDFYGGGQLRAGKCPSAGNLKQFLSPSAASSSIFSSALTASSLLPSSLSETSAKLQQQQSKNKQRTYVNESGLVSSMPSGGGELYERPDSSLKYIDESVYEILSNANSGTAKIENTKAVGQNPKEKCCLISMEKNLSNEKIASNKNKLEGLKQTLVGPNRDKSPHPNLSKMVPSELVETKINVKSRIDIFESRANTKSQTSSSKLNPAKERANPELAKAFYLKPPTNYDDDHELFMLGTRSKKTTADELASYRRYRGRNEIVNVAEDYANDEDEDEEDPYSDQANYTDEGDDEGPGDQLSCFDFIDLIDCKDNYAKYSFFPPATNVTTLTAEEDDNDEDDDDDEEDYQESKHPLPMRFMPPPPPTEFDTGSNTVASSFKFQKYLQPPQASAATATCLNTSEYSNTSCYSTNPDQSTSSSASPSSCSDHKTSPRKEAATKKTNFILKPKAAAQQPAQNQIKVPIISVEKVPALKASKSAAPKSRRKGLEEVFPDIKISSKQQPKTGGSSGTDCCDDGVDMTSPNEYTRIYWTDESNSSDSQAKNPYQVEDPDWCPASDLCDFDLDESEMDAMQKERRSRLVMAVAAAKNQLADTETRNRNVFVKASQNLEQFSPVKQCKQQMGGNKKAVKSSDLFLPLKNLNSFYY